MADIMEETFTAYEGRERTFPLEGKILVVPARMDVLNHYRLQFKELARLCCEKAVEGYKTNIHDLDTFLEQFPAIYQQGLDIAAGKAIDILISSGIYSISAGDFKDRHTQVFHNGLDDYQTVANGVQKVHDNNASVSNMIFGSINSALNKNDAFGEKVFNGLMRDTKEKNARLSDEQKKKMYKCINKNALFTRIYLDYWNTYLTLVSILRDNGEDIWFADSGTIEGLENILQSMYNPNFPQEKILDILFDAILKKPYDTGIYKVLKEKYGQTEEANAIVDYFDCLDEGDLLSVVLGQDQEDTDDSQDAEPAGGQDEQAEQQNEKKGFLSMAGKVNGEKVKKGLKIGGTVAAGVILGAVAIARNGGDRAGRDDGKKDLFGTAVCQRCTSDSKDPRHYSCLTCPAASRCTQQYR